MQDQPQTTEMAYLVNGQVVLPEQYEQMRRHQLSEMYSLFARRRDEWVAYRAKNGVETRWRRSMAMYYGEDDDSATSQLERTLRDGPSRRGAPQTPRSRVVVNIVRPKVDQAVARMCEILLPVDDRNWGIEPTPVPESIAGMVGDPRPLIRPDGTDTGMSRDAAAQGFMKDMKRKAELMQDEIDDVLSECDYNSHQRQAIFDGVLLGTAVMIGPVAKMCAKRRWVPSPDGTARLESAYEPVASSHRADPWDVWFDPSAGNDHRRGAGFYYRKMVTRKELREMADVPGFDAGAIRTVLSQRPTRTKVVEGRVKRDTCYEDSYEMWLYFGDVEPEQMSLLSSFTDDPLENVANGVVVMVEDVVIGAMDSMIPDGSMPCDVWCYRDADDSPYGFGLPDEMVHQQAVVTAAWRQVMDGGKLSLSSQVVVNKSRVKPQNGSYTIEPYKVWLADEDTEDVTKAMASVDFASHLGDLLAIAKAAMEFSDQETSMPQLMGGEKGTAPETLGGMIMLYQNANVVLRYRVKRYDDRITDPHISRHYDWQMAYSKRREIKGDMNVKARGSTALLEKDIQNQATLNLAAITSNPRYQAYLDAKEELKVILKALKIDPGSIMPDDKEIERRLQQQAQNPPQDPNLIRAQAQVQVKQLDVQDKAEDRAFQERKQAAELEHKNASLAYNADREQKEFQIAMTESALTRDIALLKLASTEQDNEASRVAKERLEAIKIDAANQRFNAEAALRVNTGEGI